MAVDRMSGPQVLKRWTLILLDEKKSSYKRELFLIGAVDHFFSEAQAERD